MELKGIVYSVGETQQVRESFSKREFVLYVENPDNKDWSNYYKMELKQDKCSLIDGVKKYDELTVQYNLNGRKWDSPEKGEMFFTTLDVWKVEKVNVSQPAPQPVQQAQHADPQDDLPF